jgi:hypothetical protein
MDLSPLRAQIERSCRRLLSEQDRDPYSDTQGCFDRRYWAWKMVDFPEATLQRNVASLFGWWRQTPQAQSGIRETLLQAIQAGIQFALGIQHRDGSFDQAFPHEHSFGATAFLLPPLLESFAGIREACSPPLQERVEEGLFRSAWFLCRAQETHGFISNHLAGAAWALSVSADFFQEPHFEEHSCRLLDRVLSRQSVEGWFEEYGGADPGYQTLCLYYLSQMYQRRKDPALRGALEKATSFLSWFVHPDGTFGGHYGSRRTAVYYPGGLALLSREFPSAWAITRFMLPAMEKEQTTTLNDVDMGNLAPLISNYQLLLHSNLPEDSHPAPLLPFERNESRMDFPQAGLYIRGTLRYYAILGACNGGALKVFDRRRPSLLWDDGGFVGRLSSGRFLTTQVTDRNRTCQVSEEEITLQTPFYYMGRAQLHPLSGILFRILNLSAMRLPFFREWVKRGLVRFLILGRRKAPLRIIRKIRWGSEEVRVNDFLQMERPIRLQWLQRGVPFCSIHMASSRYFEGFPPAAQGRKPVPVQVEKLKEARSLQQEVVI